MEVREAEKIRQQWKGEDCNHPTWAKEQFEGMDTGDKVCTRCGHDQQR